MSGSAASTRLAFLYPHFFRSTAAARLGGESAAGQTVSSAAASARTSRAVSPCRRRHPTSTASGTPRPHLSVASRRGRYAGAPPRSAGFATSTAPKQLSTFPRHGTAVEPTPLAGEPPSKPPPPPSPKSATTAQAMPTPPPPSPPAKSSELARESKDDHPQTKEKKDAAEDKKAQDGESDIVEQGQQQQQEPQQGETKSQAQPPLEQRSDALDAAAKSPQPASSSPESMSRIGPMDAILYVGPPEGYAPPAASDDPSAPGSGQQSQHLPPHLTPPPYVHHFDSYSLVKQLEAGGYTQVQAITAMKAVRALLAQNLDVAQAGLVSKSHVENETYLFRAACSELSTEVRKNRRVEDEEIRQQRTLLQHEADIVAQSLNQEILALNDNIRGMFNDRKMAVREEQKGAESAIQQINYKISVMLNSDARSEVEGVRWVLIRRSVLGIIFMVLASLGTLRYASYVSHVRQKEAEASARAAELLRKDGGRSDHAAAPDAAEMLTAN